jgi:hypothetical protein
MPLPNTAIGPPVILKIPKTEKKNSLMGILDTPIQLQRDPSILMIHDATFFTKPSMVRHETLRKPVHILIIPLVASFDFPVQAPNNFCQPGNVVSGPVVHYSLSVLGVSSEL